MAKMSLIFKEKGLFVSLKSAETGVFMKTHNGDGVPFVYGVRGPGIYAILGFLIVTHQGFINIIYLGWT